MTLPIDRKSDLVFLTVKLHIYHFQNKRCRFLSRTISCRHKAGAPIYTGFAMHLIITELAVASISPAHPVFLMRLVSYSFRNMDH